MSFVNEVRGRPHPSGVHPSCDKGFRAAPEQGPADRLSHRRHPGHSNDGQSHPVDSSDIAFQAAAQGAFWQAYERAKPVALEPIMKVSVEGPDGVRRHRLRQHQPATGGHRQFGRGRPVRPRRRRGPAGRDVRLLHRAPLPDPGQSGVHDGIPEVRASAGGRGRGAHRRVPGKYGKTQPGFEIKGGTKAHGPSEELFKRSPLRILESSIHGGLGKGNIGVLASRKGVGKTACLVHIATDKLLQGKPVIHVTYASPGGHIINWYEDIFKELAKNRDRESAARVP